MDSYLHVRCLFCETGKEKRVVHTIHENGWGRALFAQRARFMRRNGDWEKVEVPLLPGYVFVYEDREVPPAADYQGIPHVIRLLTYEGGTDRLMGDDLKFADWLWRMDGEIGVIGTVQVGDRVEIADGVFRELRARILHVNRRQKKIYVSMETQSIPLHTWLAYEQVQKIGAGEEETPGRVPPE